MSFVDDPSFGGLGMPSGGFSSGPAPPRPSTTPAPGSTTGTTGSTATPPATGGQVDPRDTLAELLAPVPGHPLLRRGKVKSLDTSSSVWAAYVATDGYDDRPRRMTWNGNGSKPAVNDAVYYYNASPQPVIIGRVPTPNQNQDFGTGTVSGGSFVDSSGNLRTDITSTSSSVSSLQSTVNSINSTVSSHTSTLNSHTSTLSSHTSSINSLNSTVSTHTSQIASHTSSIASLNSLFSSQQNQINDLVRRLGFYESNMVYLANLGANYKNHTAHPPPGAP